MVLLLGPVPAGLLFAGDLSIEEGGDPQVAILQDGEANFDWLNAEEIRRQGEAAKWEKASLGDCLNRMSWPLTSIHLIRIPFLRAALDFLRWRSQARNRRYIIGSASQLPVNSMDSTRAPCTSHAR
jgi:hypothetical protein